MGCCGIDVDGAMGAPSLFQSSAESSLSWATAGAMFDVGAQAELEVNGEMDSKGKDLGEVTEFSQEAGQGTDFVS